MTSPDSVNSLLLALGLSTSNPTPPTFKFNESNPMGMQISEVEEEKEISKSVTDDQGTIWYQVSSQCNELVSQVNRLRNLQECVLASNRLLTAIQTQTLRHVVLKIMSVLSKSDPSGYQNVMEDIGLNDVQHLIRLLRLVQAKRISQGTFGLEGCIESAIINIVSQGGAASTQLLKVHLKLLIINFNMSPGLF